MLTEIEVPEKCVEVMKPSTFYRNVVLRGGRGSAKSWTIARKLVLEASYTRNRYLCCREMQNSIKDSVHRLLCDQIQMLQANDLFQVQKDAIYSKTGSEFLFKGLRHNIAEIKSTEGVTRCWVEEAEKVSQDSWDILTPTIRAKGSQFYISYNPGQETDPTDLIYYKNTPPDTLLLEMNYEDNPWFWGTASVRDMEYCKKIDFEKYEHIWLGKYKRYANALILRGKFRVEAFDTPADARFYFGLDFGFSVSPTALVRCFIKDRKLYIDYEAYGHGIENNDLHQFIATVPGTDKWPIIADCSRPETISFLAHPFDSKGVHYDGYRCVPCEKGKGSVEDGIQFLRGFEEIIIHPRCTGAADDAANYKWKVDRNTNEILPIPADGSDDCWDACLRGGTMILTETGEKAIKDVEVGEKVLTRSGFKPVLWSGVSRTNAEILKLETESGKILYCTPDHKILTNCGFIRSDALRYGHEILTLSEASTWQSMKRWFFKAKRIIGAPHLKNGPRKCISGERGDTVTTGISGSQKMDQSQTGITSITRTETHSTTISRILNALNPKSIFVGMHQRRKGKRHQGELSTKSGTLPQNGMEAKRGSNGIGSTLSELQRRDHFVSENANNAESLIPCGSDNGQDSAQINAKQNGEGIKELITSTGIALCAELLSHITGLRKSKLAVDRVLTVTVLADREAEVFDLTIKDQPEFFANGILVHNCRYALEKLMKKKVTLFDLV